MEDAAARYISDRWLEMGCLPRLDRFFAGYTFRSAAKADGSHDFRKLVSTLECIS